MSSDVKPAQLARLASIDFHMLHSGFVVRQEHARRFGLEGATATRDLALYCELSAPGTVGYNKTEKCHTILPGFKPLYQQPSSMTIMILGQYHTPEELHALHRLLNARFGLPEYKPAGTSE